MSDSKDKSSQQSQKIAITSLCFLITACGGGGDGTLPVTVLATTSVVSASPAAIPTTYTMSNIIANGSPYGNKAVNEKGHVYGETYNYVTNTPHAFIYDGKEAKTLETVPGLGLGSSISAMNNSGVVVGTFRTGTRESGAPERAFTYDGIKMTDLGAIGERGFSFGQDINETGQVVGTGIEYGTNYRGFFHDGVSMVSVGLLPGGSASQLFSLNNKGQAVGAAANSPNSARPVLYENGVLKDLGTLEAPGYLNTGYSIANLINDSGVVAGSAHITYDIRRAFIYENSVLKPIAVGLGSWEVNTALDLNASGKLVGYAQNSQNDYQTMVAFYYDGATVREIPPFGGVRGRSVAKAINSHGHVVGETSIPINGRLTQRAFIWSESEAQPIDLNTRVTNNPENIEIYTANSISDSGYIVVATNNGPMLLTPANPAPPPSAPTVGLISANEPVPIGSPVNVSVNFTDLNVTDTHTAEWVWEGSGMTPGVLTESNGTGMVTGTKVFASAGVYRITAKITDSAGLSTQVARTVAVYDPSAGFVTGGGWIASPPGAYKVDPSMMGKANFGFVSKYQKGATKPSGETEFQFQTAKLNFFSNNYEWLVVAGARAQYKGTGTINGAGNYKFMLTAVDGQVAGGGGADRFRMKIWHYDAEAQVDVVDYDNHLEASTEGGISEGTILGGGNISIKSK